MNLKELKKEAFNIKELDLIVENFEQNSALLDRKLIQNLKDDEITKIYLQIKLIHSSLMEKQIVTERIQTLIQNLGKMRAALVTKDKKKGDMLINKFLNKGRMQIMGLINENKKFKKELSEIGNMYDILSKRVLKIKNNARFIAKLEKHNHENFIKEIDEIYEKQKHLLYNAGNHFVKFSKKLLK